MTGYETDCIFLLYIMITHTIIKMITSIAILIPTVTPIRILLVEVVDMVDVTIVVVDSMIDIEVLSLTCDEVIDVSLVDDGAVGRVTLMPLEDPMLLVATWMICCINIYYIS